MIGITPGKIAGVRLLRPTVQHDRRGNFVKVVQEDVFAAHGMPARFAEQFYSVSANNVLRGLHFQTPPHDHYKLVTCIEGSVFDVVVDVTDPLLPENSGRWRLTGDREQARCVPTDEPADLACGVADLAAVYLGGPSLRSLADAGRVRELRHGAVAEANTAFGWDRAPAGIEIF